jgi:hypothetical protein
MKFDGDGPWALPLAGFEVGRLTFGLPIDVYLYGDGGPARLQLPGPFELQVPGGDVRTADPEIHSWQEMTELLSLRHDRVAGATAWKDARLRIDFLSGRAISAHSTGSYESWEVEAKGWKIVGTPGEVLIWDEDSRNFKFDSPEFAELLERWTAEGRTPP